jgi:hypothetical protein
MNKAYFRLAAEFTQNNVYSTRASGGETTIIQIGMALEVIKQALVDKGIAVEIVDQSFREALGSRSMYEMLEPENRCGLNRALAVLGL